MIPINLCFFSEKTGFSDKYIPIVRLFFMWKNGVVTKLKQGGENKRVLAITKWNVGQQFFSNLCDTSLGILHRVFFSWEGREVLKMCNMCFMTVSRWKKLLYFLFKMHYKNPHKSQVYARLQLLICVVTPPTIFLKTWLPRKFFDRHLWRAIQH